MTEISSNKTIAKNSILLYFRMMFKMVVSLYTTRVNLSILGIEDNGIYEVVGGVVAMFAFLNSSLSGATSRFLTFELGRNDSQKLKATFSTALNLHIFIAIIVLLFSETIGLWFLENKLVIPESRMLAARVVYQFSIFAAMLSIMQIPFNASIISHERMGVFAYVSILDVSLKLLACYFLYITPFDKLMTYGLLILIVTMLIQGIYTHYCFKHFKECRFRFVKDLSIIKPMLSFSGWDLFGNFSVMARGQGVNIVLNLFFGPVINAAAGFSSTIGGAVYGFANNFMTAIRPPIVKSYSIGDYDKMQNLMINASKYSFSLLLLLSAPFIFESKYIIELWLKTPPQYTDIFCVLALALSLLSSLFFPLVFVIHATGKIKFMSIANGSILLLVIPITYVALLYGGQPIVPYITNIILLFFVALSTLYSVKKLIPEFSVKRYFKKAIFPCLITALIVLSITTIVHVIAIDLNPLLRFIITCSFSSISLIISVFFLVINSGQREKITNKIVLLFKHNG